MKLIAKIGTGLCVMAALSYGANINGKLIDVACYNNSRNAQTSSDRSHEKLEKSCAATASTTSFAVMTSSGKVYDLDASGNAKAMAAFKDGNLKPDDDGDVHASVSGSTQGNSVKVDSVSGTKSREESR